MIPPLPDHRPQCSDPAPLGVSFFRTCVGAGEHDLENLTLPRTYFGKSEVGPMSFRNTNLSESTMCWNDFIEVDFSDADLSGCDLRASIYSGVKFVRTILQNADLRRATYENCDFQGADMRGAQMTYEQADQITLSHQQRQEIDWQDSDGEDPPGG
jgi:uncharacterized protein YjbI with pentapeptide repeats